MTKTILFFTGIFFMALIALVSCTPSPQEPDITSPQQPGNGNGETPQQPEVPSTEATNLDYQPNTINNYGNGNIASGTLDGNQEIQGSLYKLLYAGDTEVFFYESGAISNGILASEQTLELAGNPVTFEGGSEINFQEGGQLGLGVVSGTLQIGANNRIAFAMNTTVSFHTNGVAFQVHITSPQVVQVGVNPITFIEVLPTSVSPIPIEFSESGNIVSGAVAAGQMVPIGINHISFLAMNFDFNENGSVIVTVVVLDSPQTLDVDIDGVVTSISFDSGQINFSESGAIESGTLASNQTLPVGTDNITFGPGQISFHPNGAIESGILASPLSLVLGGDMNTFDTDTLIFFNEDGVIAQIDLFSDQTITIKGRDITFTFFFPLSFSETGAIESGTLASDQTLEVGGMMIPFASFFSGNIFFHENGEIRSGTLSQGITIGGVSYSSGDTISFDDQGMVVQ